MAATSRADNKAYEEWQELCGQIARATPVEVNENDDQKGDRVDNLSKNFVRFATYYFPHYMDSEFGWFHKKAAKEIEADKNCFAVLEWAREHAKSVFANVMVPMWLISRNELTGMVTVSANETKAQTLLGDIQAEFTSNRRWLNDFGELAKHGDWQDGKFSTTDGTGFWAFGRGQSPRGIRKAAKRPNYAVIDDIDDKVIVKNEQRVKDTVNWIFEDLFGALSIKGARVVVAGNRIHKKAILSHIVGDVDPADPKRKGITHIKVYAVEDPRTHKKADPKAKGAKPAWKERYTLKELNAKMEIMGYRSARREYFHEHHEEGIVFQNEWIHWSKPLPMSQYDGIVVYTDPSFKDTKKNDYKAVVMVGRAGKYIDLLRVWLKQTNVASMVQVNYDWWEELENQARYYMEANFMQDLLLDDFTTEGLSRGGQMPIRGDKRSKGNKEMRIENLQPLFSRGLVRFNERERSNPDMQTFLQQLLGFPYGHDDGPDAFEGAVYKLQKRNRANKSGEPRMGKYRRKSKRD